MGIIETPNLISAGADVHWNALVNRLSPCSPMSNPMDPPDAENKDSTGKELPQNTSTQSTTRKEPQSRSSMWPLPSISVTRHPSGKLPIFSISYIQI